MWWWQLEFQTPAVRRGLGFAAEEWTHGELIEIWRGNHAIGSIRFWSIRGLRLWHWQVVHGFRVAIYRYTTEGEPLMGKNYEKDEPKAQDGGAAPAPGVPSPEPTLTCFDKVKQFFGKIKHYLGF